MSSTVNVYFKRFFKEYFSIDLVRFENYHVQNIPHSKFVDLKPYHAQNNKLFSWLQFNEQRDDIKMWLKEQWASECHFILRIVSKKISISTQKKPSVRVLLAICRMDVVWLHRIAWKLLELCDTIYIQCPFDGIK